MRWSQIKAWLARVPLGLWAAFAAAGSLFWLYMRGRRLDAELARESLRRVVAEAQVTSAVSEGRIQVHKERARAHEQRIDELEQKRVVVAALDAADQKRLAAMHPDEITEAYLDLVRSVPKIKVP